MPPGRLTRGRRARARAGQARPDRDRLNAAAARSGAPRDTSGFTAGVAAVTPRIEARFRVLRAGILDNWVADDGSLTVGDNIAGQNARAAAERVGGAQTLLNGYVALGLPQALTTDDTLRGLVAGDGRNALARPYADDGRAEPASNVPDQVAAFFRYLQPREPVGDPLDTLSPAFRRVPAGARGGDRGRTSAMAVPRASPPTDGGRLDETSPMCQLHDRPAGAEPSRAGRPPRPAGPGRPRPRRRRRRRRTPAVTSPPRRRPPPRRPRARLPSVTAPAPARARIVRAPRVRGQAITFTVRCESGTCRVATALTAGRRSVGRAATVSIAAGAQRTSPSASTPPGAGSSRAADACGSRLASRSRARRSRSAR